jgi:hypothetical protein
VAATLAALPGVKIVPDPPHTNMMHVYLAGEPARLEAATLAIAEEAGVLLFNRVMPADVPGWGRIELNIGEGAFEIDDAELAAWFGRILAS